MRVSSCSFRSESKTSKLKYEIKTHYRVKLIAEVDNVEEIIGQRKKDIN